MFRTGLTAVVSTLAFVVFAAGAQAKTFTVTKTADTADGHCNSDCSLREAITAANLTGVQDTIRLKAKTYKLTRQGAGDDNVAGDLDVTKDLRIAGAGPSKTTIQGAWTANSDRLIQVLAGAELMVSGLTLRDGNAGSNLGGGVYVNANAKLKLTGVDLISNRATLASAIENRGTTVMSRVVVRKNHATGCCTFYNVVGGTARMTNVVFDRNTTVNDSAGIYSNDDATLKNVTFSDNRSHSTGGGGIFAAGGSLDLTNVTFSGNVSDADGGAIYAQSGVVNANNVTITGNHAGQNGGGVFGAGGTVNLQNTILAGNTDAGGNAPDCGGGPFTSLGHNMVGNMPGCNFTPGPGDLSVIGNLGLRPLADNGGFTQTVALTKNSPAINKGSTKTPGSGGPACDAHDQRGVKRPQGPRCDIGAYERKR